MHPAMMKQLVADRIREMHAEAEDERRARRVHRARRRVLSMRLRLPASGTLSYDDPRLGEGQRPAIIQQPSASPLPVMTGSPPDSGDTTTRRGTLDHCG
jgi:hypothetical protein